MKLSVSIGYQEPNDVTSAFTIELTTSAFRVNRQGILEVANSNLDRDPPNPGILTFQVTTPQHLGFFDSLPLAAEIENGSILLLVL